MCKNIKIGKDKIYRYYTAKPHTNQAEFPMQRLEGDSMDHLMQCADPHSRAIMSVVNEIVELIHPKKIYLYNLRSSAAGTTTSFKLCVVGDFTDKSEAERELYLKIDSVVPFDIILYTPFEWDALCARSESFASRISLSGTILYE